MKTESLEDFLRKKKEKNESELKAVDWEKRRAKWLSSVDQLYEKVRQWLRKPMGEGVIKVTFSDEVISEEHLGSYPVKKMRLTVGSEQVTFHPQGTLIVGACGRVDMVGDEGSVMLVLLDWKQWNIAVRTPKIKYWPLTKESFSEALKQVMRK